MNTNTNIRARLTDWAVCSPLIDPYQPPECAEQRLCGYVYGHPNFEDNYPVTTSPIIGRTATFHVKTLSGTLYELGEVDSKYEEAFRNARERLFNSLPLVEE